MTNDQIISLILGILGAGSFFGFLQFLINRKDSKNDKLDDILDRLSIIENKQDKCALSETRSELLIMMNHYKKDTSEIMRLAQKYFEELKGDFYMTSIFQKWMKTNKIETPVWFKED